MRRWLALLVGCLVTAPAFAAQPIVLLGQTSAEFEMAILDTDGNGISGLAAEHIELKARCDGDSTITTIDENDGAWLFQEQPAGSANYRIRFNPSGQSIGQTLGSNCYLHAQGVDSLGGIIGATAKVLTTVVKQTGEVRCQITAATSGTSFTIANCVSGIGEAITLANGMFEGVLMKAYTRTATACNVVGQRVLVQDQTGGVITVYAQISAAVPIIGFSATPNTTNCGVTF